MIEQNEILDDVRGNLALMCDGGCSGADLAAVAGVAITNKLRAVSVLPTVVSQIWPWIENTNIKIITRFYVNGKIDDNFMSDFSSQVIASFRDGADGAMVFLHMRDVDRFVSELSYVRDDLFFNKILAIGIDICEIDASDWDGLFKLLRSVRADALTLFLSRDDGDKSDFVGRVYAMLTANMADWRGCVYFVPGNNIMRIDQFHRLTQQLRPNMAPTMMFFVNN